jgi:hypothetical protein
VGVIFKMRQKSLAQLFLVLEYFIKKLKVIFVQQLSIQKYVGNLHGAAFYQWWYDS